MSWIPSGVDRARGEPAVVLACSSGGLDALSTVLGMLPADPGFGLVVVKHVSPSVPTMLPSLLRTRSALSVRAAADGDRIAPGTVLVAPTGHHALITQERRLTLVPCGPVPPYRPSADLLLTTLAVAYGDLAIAVILTGRGNDGATGASVVHHFGGTVIVATPESSAEPAMPQATIDRGVADHVTAVDGIADLLVRLARSRTDQSAIRNRDRQQ